MICLNVNLRKYVQYLQEYDYAGYSQSLTAAAAKSLQSCPTLCDPINGSPPGSPIPGILQAITLEWVAISFSRGSSRPRNQTHVSCTAGRFFTTEPPGSHIEPSPKGPHEGRRDCRRQESPWSKPLKNQRENWPTCRRHLSHTTGNAAQSSQRLPPRNPRRVL